MPSVLNLNLKYTKDRRFNSLANIFTGIPDKFQLIPIFENLNNIINVREKTKKYIPDFPSLKRIQNQMYSVERADNNLIKINKTRLMNILEEAWGG